ncbi:unnamed protein product [Rotaria socialis]|uniref:HTH psq-type domain-containing protein n=1 Tax=Rotaria socialis TaxID=392032 RepID=A0A818KHG8_9BILA|nr:unnamed protein product [Rotaria socialis]CAF3561894.1 unnamed protein product [Rotaria socialis]
MPRTYIRKKTPTYSIADLKLALDLIGDGKTTVIEASNNYRIPIATLYSRLSGSRGGNPCGNKILSDGEEKFLIHVIHKFQEWQHPLTRSDFTSIARTFMIEMNKKKITEDSLELSNIVWTMISNLFRNHLLPSHCAGGFSKAGVYPFDKRTSSLLFDAMKTLYPDFDQSPVPDPMIFQNHASSNTTELDDTFTQKPDINYNTNSSNNKDSNNHNSFERETKYRIGSSTQPLSTVAYLETSDYSVVDAITVAIKNHMTPTVVATKGTKRKIDRPYGESITSVDAYMKIKKKETTRVKRSNKENLQPKTKTIGTRQRKKKALPENPVANNVYMNVPHVDQLALNNASFQPYPQQISYNSSLTATTSPTYTTMLNYNMSHSYAPGVYENPTNWHLNEYRSCYKCNNTIHFNTEQVSQCITCDRLCCATCMYHNPFLMNSYLKCEYCALNDALHTAR